MISRIEYLKGDVIMKSVKKMIMMLGMLVAIFALGIPSLNTRTVEAAKVKISKKKATLTIGKTLKLKVKKTKKKVKWSSSNKNVATVSKKGKVKAKGTGKATITAKVGKKKLRCKVTVENPKINKTEITLKVGGKYQLKVTGTTQRVDWSSDDLVVAEVSGKGLVTARKKGTAIITAYVGGKYLDCTVNVSGSAKSSGNGEKEAEKKKEEVFSVDKTNIELTVGQSANIIVTEPKDSEISWHCDNTIFNAAWGEWNGNKCPLKITATEIGETTIVITEDSTGKQIPIKLKVKPKKLSEYYDLLRTFIRNNGVYDSSGRLGIAGSYYHNGNDETYAIYYEEDTGKFRFLSISKYSNTQSLVEVYIDVSKDSYVYPQFTYIDDNYKKYFISQGKIYAATYTTESMVPFTVSDSGGLGSFSSDYMYNISNAGVQVAFALWDKLLREDVGISLNNLGFAKY